MLNKDYTITILVPPNLSPRGDVMVNYLNDIDVAESIGKARLFTRPSLYLTVDDGRPKILAVEEEDKEKLKSLLVSNSLKNKPVIVFSSLTLAELECFDNKIFLVGGLHFSVNLRNYKLCAGLHDVAIGAYDHRCIFLHRKVGGQAGEGIIPVELVKSGSHGSTIGFVEPIEVGCKYKEEKQMLAIDASVITESSLFALPPIRIADKSGAFSSPFYSKECIEIRFNLVKAIKALSEDLSESMLLKLASLCDQPLLKDLLEEGCKLEPVLHSTDNTVLTETNGVGLKYPEVSIDSTIVNQRQALLLEAVSKNAQFLSVLMAKQSLFNDAVNALRGDLRTWLMDIQAIQIAELEQECRSEVILNANRATFGPKKSGPFDLLWDLTSLLDEDTKRSLFRIALNPFISRDRRDEANNVGIEEAFVGKIFPPYLGEGCVSDNSSWREATLEFIGLVFNMHKLDDDDQRSKHLIDFYNVQCKNSQKQDGLDKAWPKISKHNKTWHFETLDNMSDTNKVKWQLLLPCGAKISVHKHLVLDHENSHLDSALLG